MRKVYLDNAATSAVSKRVVEAMMPYFSEIFGNPSSIHSFGRDSRKALEESRNTIAKKLRADPSEIIFTSGGTESNNLALEGAAYANQDKGKHIITTVIEHSSVLKPFKYLEKQGFEVTYLPVDEHGLIDANNLEKEIRKDTFLISIGHANNEIGVIQNIREVGKISRERGVLFHTDACQSFTKTELDVVKQNLDLVTINAHKIHGPKGVGALYVRKGVKITPLELGGGHEKGLRSGTQNIPGIVGFAQASQLIMGKEVAHMSRLRDKLIKQVLEGIRSVRLNGHPTERLCNNANFTLQGIEGESLLLRLDALGIACSTGSACSSNTLEPSYVLLALGLSHEQAHGSIRLSNSSDLTDEDIDYVVESLVSEIGKLRAISPIAR